MNQSGNYQETPNDDLERLLTRLRKVFKDGYRPARGTEKYSTIVSNYTRASNVVNCLGHVLNLRNQQLENYNIVPYHTFSYLPGITHDSNELAKTRLFDFIKATGLKIEECDPGKPLDDFKSWKTALYFDNDEDSKDFHFLLEDEPGVWSSKLGYTSFLEHVYTKNPPVVYRSLQDFGRPYTFYGAYKITNPRADAHNPYTSHRVLRNCSENKKGHCTIEGHLKDNYIDEFEPLLYL